MRKSAELPRQAGWRQAAATPTPPRVHQQSAERDRRWLRGLLLHGSPGRRLMWAQVLAGSQDSYSWTSPAQHAPEPPGPPLKGNFSVGAPRTGPWAGRLRAGLFHRNKALLGAAKAAALREEAETDLGPASCLRSRVPGNQALWSGLVAISSGTWTWPRAPSPHNGLCHLIPM